jgi:aspartate racemase
MRKGKWKDLTGIMVDIAVKLKNSGADFIVICTNTMHKMAGDIEKKAGIKVLHIAEAAGKKIAEKGMRKVALLGTKFTMEEDFYKKVLKGKYNISVVIPEKDDRGLINDVIFNELCKGILNEDSKNQFLRIIEKLAAKGAEGVILGCTEIPLLIKQEDVKIPVFDTTAIHAVSAFEFAIKESI